MHVQEATQYYSVTTNTMADTGEMMAVAASATANRTPQTPQPNHHSSDSEKQQPKPKGGLYVALAACSVVQLALVGFQVILSVILIYWHQDSNIRDSPYWVSSVAVINAVAAVTAMMGVGTGFGVALGVQWLKHRKDTDIPINQVRFQNHLERYVSGRIDRMQQMFYCSYSAIGLMWLGSIDGSMNISTVPMHVEYIKMLGSH